MRPGNVAEALEHARGPWYLVDVGPGPLEAVRGGPGVFLPGTVAVLGSMEPQPWETARELLEEP